jgi:hypothetical protein
MADLIYHLAGLYLALGVACALPFAVLVQRLEPSARGASPLFRLLIVPGAALLWPLIARRSLRAWRRRSA